MILSFERDTLKHCVAILTTFFQDTLLLSLHNFLALVFARLPAPRLSEFQSTATKLKRLREENDVLRQTLIKQRQQQQQAISGGDK